MSIVQSPFVSAKQDAVILLHGLARTKASMAGLEKDLRTYGYQVVNMDYPSRQHPIEMLAQSTIPQALKACKALNVDKIHVVTHSMGGILIRYYLTHNTIENLGRIVMLSPPNQGSEVVDKLKTFPPFQWLNGPAGQQLGTDAHSVPNQLPPPDYEVGIITGDRSINWILSCLIPGPDDGKVSVKNAAMEKMTDFLVVHKTHPFIMKSSLVHQQVRAFITNGEFIRD